MGQGAREPLGEACLGHQGEGGGRDFLEASVSELGGLDLAAAGKSKKRAGFQEAASDPQWGLGGRRLG